MAQKPGGFSEDQSPFQLASFRGEDDLAPPSEAILLLAEAEFKDAIASFNHAGRIQADLTTRLTSMSEQLSGAAARLKTTLEKTQQLH